ncbi:flagellar biosynthesis protein FlhF [Tuberibacillus sp. Marseille-P3662]|uniref:flagellar biosynthesis protein FlhF n=1 Tax=Tuberibacillus sp. Marseille-P3662 TaxID=1965358 RepID=UPI0020CAB39D|nr:flagellar biosynthesis protein FlhF [Tuberibacillus sp. Marseille-P3662]
MKKFIAPTMNEAMQKVKRELGSDAVILFTKKTHKRRWFNLIKSPAVEVVAAIDDEPAYPERKPTVRQGTKPLHERRNVSLSKNEHNEPGQRMDVYPPPIASVYEHMITKGLRPDIAHDLCRPLIKHWYVSDEQIDKNAIESIIKTGLEQKLANITFGTDIQKTGVINLVGPTGVGKTTTAAKLASHAVLNEQHSVAFITTDTYRIAAIEQLKTYAKILNVPVEVAYSSEDFNQALTKHEDKDVVIVDTAGGNYQLSQTINQLKTMIPFSRNMETFLVLSAAAKSEDQIAVIHQFQDVPVSQLIMTKMDETQSPSALLNVVNQCPMDIAYFTNGQDVPDDWQLADQSAFINHVMEDLLYG